MLKKLAVMIVLLLFLTQFFAATAISGVKAWGNGGYSTDSSHPSYGSHDWIAEHALDWMPAGEKQFIVDNKNLYLYGTELPDNNQAPDKIGDTTKHHFYYNSAKAVVDDVGAGRASEVYAQALNFLKAGDVANGVKYAGVICHYVADMAVFGHVMGAATDWGAEAHHSDYEDYVGNRMSSYSSEFSSYLVFDGTLETLSAYNAAKTLAYDTTFDSSGHGWTCVWMDQHYDWGNLVFKNRCGQSLNLAVNLLADVLHSLWVEAGRPIPEFPVAALMLPVAILLAVAILKIRRFL